MAKIGNETKLFLKLVNERAAIYAGEVNIALQRKDFVGGDVVSVLKGKEEGISIVREIIADLILEIEGK